MVWPATETVPVRAPPEFDRTLRVIVVLPVPPAALTTLIQLAFEVTAHAQLDPVVIVSANAPPAEDTGIVVEERT